MLFPSLLAYDDYGFLALRIALGVIFIVHAIPKLKNPAGIAGAIGAPVWFGTLVGLGEVGGSLLVLLGLFTQVGALILAVVMVGATYLKIVRWNMPFTAMDKVGWEFDLMLFASALLLLLTGPGSLALEGMFSF